MFFLQLHSTKFQTHLLQSHLVAPHHIWGFLERLVEPPWSFEIEDDAATQDIMAPQGFANAVYQSLRLGVGTGCHHAPVFSSWVWMCSGFQLAILLIYKTLGKCDIHYQWGKMEISMGYQLTIGSVWITVASTINSMGLLCVLFIWNINYHQTHNHQINSHPARKHHPHES